MAESDRERWDARYAANLGGLNPPDDWLCQQAASRPAGVALDLACGLGHNAIWLAQRGWTVTGIDVSPVGLSLARVSAVQVGVPDIKWIEADLQTFELSPSTYDLIVVFRFLDRDWLPRQIESALQPRGLLVYETFSRGQFSRHDNHLRNPQFALGSGELPTLFPSLIVEQHEEIVLPERTVARLAARKPGGIL